MLDRYPRITFYRWVQCGCWVQRRWNKSTSSHYLFQGWSKIEGIFYSPTWPLGVAISSSLWTLWALSPSFLRALNASPSTWRKNCKYLLLLSSGVLIMAFRKFSRKYILFLILSFSNFPLDFFLGQGGIYPCVKFILIFLTATPGWSLLSVFLSQTKSEYFLLTVQPKGEVLIL